LVQTAGDLGALCERQRRNRSFDFSDRAHAVKLGAMQISVNVANRVGHDAAVAPFEAAALTWL
jgi:hypothetical protein